MIVHIECLPDETLLKKAGFIKKQIKHHTGKSRVFASLKQQSNQVAMVDEDPGAAKNPYEQVLKWQKEEYGIHYFLDEKRNNKVFVLKIKLEDWIIAACKKSNIDITKYGLPNRANALHDEINYKLNAFEKLLDALIQNKNEAIGTLQKWLKESYQ